MDRREEQEEKKSRPVAKDKLNELVNELLIGYVPKLFSKSIAGYRVCRVVLKRHRMMLRTKKSKRKIKMKPTKHLKNTKEH